MPLVLKSCCRRQVQTPFRGPQTGSTASIDRRCDPNNSCWYVSLAYLSQTLSLGPLQYALRASCHAEPQCPDPLLSSNAMGVEPLGPCSGHGICTQECTAIGACLCFWKVLLADF